MIYFKADDEPRKHHTIQVWQTPFTSPDYTPEVSAEQAQSQVYKIGNKEVVSCMAECHEVIGLLYCIYTFFNKVTFRELADD